MKNAWSYPYRDPRTVLPAATLLTGANFRICRAEGIPEQTDHVLLLSVHVNSMPNCRRDVEIARVMGNRDETPCAFMIRTWIGKMGADGERLWASSIGVDLAAALVQVWQNRATAADTFCRNLTRAHRDQIVKREK